jgi:hypothetical protein
MLAEEKYILDCILRGATLRARTASSTGTTYFGHEAVSDAIGFR